MNMNKFYIYLSSVYRIGIVGVVILMDILDGFNYEKEKLIVYVICGLYTVLFSLLHINKWVAYIELVGIIGLLSMVQEPTLHFLFIIPFTNFVSSNAKKIDIFIFWLISTSYVYYLTERPFFTLVLSVGLLTTLYVFHQRFSLIERLNQELFKTKNEINDYRDEVLTQKVGFEITTKMFYHMKELSEATTNEEVMKKMISGSMSFFNATYSCLYVIDEEEEGKVFKKVIEEGEQKRYKIPDKLVYEKGDEREALYNGEMMTVPVDIEGREWGIVSTYGKRIPLGEKGQMIVSPFSETDFETMLTYIYSVNKRVEELYISEQNEFLANNDFLTKVPNRRFFWQKMEEMVALAERGDPFTVLVMDIDNFKQFNDTYGHEMGDTVLRVVAETIQETIRKIDVVGRLGGEEFGVIIYKPNGEELKIAERIRRMVSAIPAVQQITLSIGMASYGEHGVTVQDLITNADSAMYQAKLTGKNKVVSYKTWMNMEEKEK